MGAVCILCFIVLVASQIVNFCHFRKIMNECDAGEDSEEEEFHQSEGVIDLEDYLEDLKEQDEEWAKKHSIQCL